MLLGHLAVAFAAKPLAPRVSLGFLMLAGIWLDLLWPAFLLAGVERVALDPQAGLFETVAFTDYPWSHSLLMTLVWSALAGLAWLRWRRDRRESLVVGGLVASHWLLDLVVHRADLPLWPGGAEVGLGLWSVPSAAIAVELVLLAAGAAIYAQAAPPRSRLGSWALGVLVALLAVVYAASVFGPPPAETRALALGAFAQLLFPLAGWWVDRHRGAATDGLQESIEPHAPGAV